MVRAGSASILVAPASSARGLDFRDVSFVFLLAPSVSADEYVHAAGRAGRVGQLGRGEVVSLLAGEKDLADLEGIVGGVLGMPLERVGQSSILEEGQEARALIDGKRESDGIMAAAQEAAEAVERRRQLEAALKLNSDPSSED